ncbi:hypothetical protein FPQ18DRAFT_304601 [Pyronema domesticum]|nr:hypothetical protein FPQ18DRAFT_304601 [Pyronema domesticum]
MTNMISIDYIKRKRQPTKPRDDDDFANLLREGYQKDYDTPVLHLGNQPFVFYTKLTYVDRETEKRIVLTNGTNVCMRRPNAPNNQLQYGKILFLFTHEDNGNVKIFVVLQPALHHHEQREG